MDCTASMGPWIHQAKTKLVDLVDEVCRQHPHANVQVSFVGYRDYDDDCVRMIEIPFQSAQDTMAAIRDIEAEGGDDCAEDVATGLFHALHMDWSNADVKFVFHVADAPAHGQAFHSANVSDRYPRGDPDGLDPRDSVEKFSFLDVHYTFVKIHPSTDTMIEVFHNCYSQGGTFRVIDLQPQRHVFDSPQTLDGELTRVISETLTQYYTVSPTL